MKTEFWRENCIILRTPLFALPAMSERERMHIGNEFSVDQSSTTMCLEWIERDVVCVNVCECVCWGRKERTNERIRARAKESSHKGH